MTEGDLDQQFRARLKEWREARGWSQQVLADRVGISQGKVSDLEGGRNRPILTPSDWARLAEVFGVTLDDFVGLPSTLEAQQAARLKPIASYSSNLTDGDIDLLTSVAKQLASARAVTALPSRDEIPGWDRLTPDEQKAYGRIEGIVGRANRLRAADASQPYQAGEPGARPDAKRPRGGRGPGREVGV